ncbi:MAG TPA: hypothetical protein VKX17_22690 [Planctomycetota bacterium]|nr:hypothetical protein [Planctomycetota bacterium]
MIFIRKVICATALVCCSIFAAQPGAEKPVTPVPVPREMLDGANLLIKTAGCSIALPGAGWAWMTYEKAGRNYLCLNSRTLEIYGVSVGELKGDILVAHQPESLIANEKKKVEGAGGKLESDKWEFIDVPDVKKAARVTFTETDKSGKKLLASIYLINTREHTLLNIHCTGPYAAEPEAFKTMVKSLKMIKDPAETKDKK